MIPTRCHEINGSRPPSLRVGDLSHAIVKTTSDAVRHRPRQQREPVIIYAHSPKVIHTRAEDFMALVQRLTGRLSCPDPQIRRNPNDATESSSVVHEDTNGVNTGGDEDNKKASQYRVPLFTPSSPALFDSPKPVFRRFEPGLILSPNRIDLVSPSVFKFIKEFP